MITQFFKKVFGDKVSKDIKALQPYVKAINELAPLFEKMSDDELKAQTPKFKLMLKEGKTLDDIMVEAFATVREASIRVLGMRHFDVQLMGGIVLHQGKAAEMKTGEGKTLTAPLALYLNALTGKGAHLVTPNDYLATRDAKEMGVLYNWLGLSVGVILNDMDDEERQVSYQSDITYGTNNEFAFDYLRDNMKFDLKHYVQRDHHFCIVDEVDSILIDEARTPLLISGPSEGKSEVYLTSNSVIPKLSKEKHFTVDEKSRSAVFTEDGIVEVQKVLNIENLYDVKYMDLLHALHQSLKAWALFTRDVDYVVNEGRVIIVDEFTGRLKDGSRWSDGLHQSVEAKEGVDIRSENQTLASITFQNYFRLYDKLAGMTGTAETEAEEFRRIYRLDVVVIPTNLPMIRNDQADVIFKDRPAKFKAIAKMIQERHAMNTPILVGTISIETSELISKELKKYNIPHEVLNAKQHEREAQIITAAGNAGAVTIATNMAGRGTDIKLTEESRKAGGLCIIGTERHESRRIDNQLRGRSGRQGDPGISKFFLSLEDDLLRIFGSDRISGFMNKLGMEDDEPIEHQMISNAIAKAQKKVENHNFDIRKHLLDYDNVMNDQRKVIYKLRREILNEEGNLELIFEMLEDVIGIFLDNYRPQGKATLEQWPWKDLIQGTKNLFHKQDLDISLEKIQREYGGIIEDFMLKEAKEIIKHKFDGHEQEHISAGLRELLLSTFDQFWKDHLLNMDHLKEGVNLQAYAQKDPLNEYKSSSFTIFGAMKTDIKKAIIDNVMQMHLYTPQEIEQIKFQQHQMLQEQLNAHREAKRLEERREQLAASGHKSGAPKIKSVGRNSSCNCGSGKKYKHCCGQ